MGWNAAERERVSKLERDNKKLVEYVKSLKKGFEAVVEENQMVRKENNTLRTEINLLHYRIDAHGQYNRKESFRLQKVSETDTEDPTEIIVESANFVLSQIQPDENFSEFKDRKVTRDDLQRCHRVGDKKTASSNKKARPIIAKFKDYRLRMAILLNKKKLEKNAQYKAQGRFFTEDLTPFRNKLLWYTKNHAKDAKGKNIFSNVHTRDGKIKAKKVGKESDRKWITITTPDDFHSHGHDVDISLLNDNFHEFQVLEHLPCDNSNIMELVGSFEGIEE